MKRRYKDVASIYIQNLQLIQQQLTDFKEVLARDIPLDTSPCLHVHWAIKSVGDAIKNLEERFKDD